ncbi:MAG: carbohydrate kinase family protein [Microgenomates group bacterium]
MYDVVTIGSAVVDIFIQSDEFELQPSKGGVFLASTAGDKLLVDDFSLRTGGGAGNSAVGFSRLGFRTAVITEVGVDVWSKIIEEEFHKEFVATNEIAREKREKTGGSVVLLGKNGVRTILVHRGASSMLDPVDIPKKVLQTSDWVHVTNVSARVDTLETIFTMLSKKKSKNVSWNPGRKELELIAKNKISKLFLESCHIFLVNAEEWNIVKTHRREILEKIPIVVVTNGADGGQVFHNGENIQYSAKKVKSVDNTGAGDAFGMGFVAAILKKQDVDRAIKWGQESAEHVVQQLGAKPGLRTLNEIKNATWNTPTT